MTFVVASGTAVEFQGSPAARAPSFHVYERHRHTKKPTNIANWNNSSSTALRCRIHFPLAGRISQQYSLLLLAG